MFLNLLGPPERPASPPRIFLVSWSSLCTKSTVYTYTGGYTSRHVCLRGLQEGLAKVQRPFLWGSHRGDQYAREKGAKIGLNPTLRFGWGRCVFKIFPSEALGGKHAILGWKSPYRSSAGEFRAAAQKAALAHNL